MRPRGLALTATLYVVVVVLLAGFALAALASFSYTMSQDTENSTLAFAAANTGVSHCIQNFVIRPTWGQLAGTPPGSAEGLGRNYQPPAVAPSQYGTPLYGNLTPAGEDYYVTFDPSSPWLKQYGLRVSVNNLADTQGYYDRLNGLTVPSHCVHLYVLGLVGRGALQRRRMVEVLLEYPPVQYAVAASNAIICASQVSGQPAPLVVTGQAGTVGQTADDLAAGILALNSGHSNKFSVALDNGLAIYGAVRSLGMTVPCPIPKYSPGNGIDPAPLPWAETLETADVTTDQLPDIDVTTYDNSATADTRINGSAGDSNFTQQPFTYTDATGQQQTIDAYILSGSIYVGGDLTLGDAPKVTYTPGPCGPVQTAYRPAVPVVLSNATLYVNGNFTATGGLVGVGTDFAAGNQTVASGMDSNEAHNWLSGGASASSFAGSGIALFANGSLDVSPVTMIVTGVGKVYDMSKVALLGTLYCHNTVTIHPGIDVVGSIVAAASTGGNLHTTNGDGTVIFTGATNVTYWPEFSQFGSVYANNNMKGHLLTVEPGKMPLMKVLYWHDAE